MSGTSGDYNCRVKGAGPSGDGKISLWLAEQGGQFERWFIANEQSKREILATALTAIATGFPVLATLTSTTNEDAELIRLFLFG